ncbi:hypothetical protein C731_3260 [Mycolicibacterium hassiacum DSM 44199]|uniref:Uncharacterized protein n=1 Tax=Mycolicibacterium hassiacum (strain DSM 44199 / CIP 105218 / JCM 12690 / 3849) TaxID=1122247 RepID=K5BJ99_MYCHD|nr:hypothetical protein C731_3260 [Mycolicibacterium hassiacum DSM 44199]
MRVYTRHAVRSGFSAHSRGAHAVKIGGRRARRSATIDR